MTGTCTTPVVIVFGSEPALLSAARRQHIDNFVGGDASSTLVEQGPLDAALLNDMDSPPMFSDRRVIVARAAQDADDEVTTRLISYLSDPCPTTRLVVEWASVKLPAGVAKAAAAAGVTVVDTNPPRRVGDRAAMVRDRLRRCAVVLDTAAVTLIAAHVGEDVSRVEAIAALLDSSFPPGTRLGASEVAPLLGDPGSVPMWDLTDAIDSGDIAGSLAALDRILGAGGRHPLVVLGTLRNHYERVFKVSSLGLTGEKAVADALGMKGSTFPARKAVNLARRLGPGRCERALSLISPVDAALKGGSGVSERTTVEILVARLAALSSSR